VILKALDSACKIWIYVDLKEDQESTERSVTAGDHGFSIGGFRRRTAQKLAECWCGGRPSHCAAGHPYSQERPIRNVPRQPHYEAPLKRGDVEQLRTALTVADSKQPAGLEELMAAFHAASVVRSRPFVKCSGRRFFRGAGALDFVLRLADGSR